jgi:uncharacterized membrane protein YdbT with pleckstrin-like domain
MDYQEIWQKVLASDETIEYEFSVGKLFRQFNIFIKTFLGIIIAVLLYSFWLILKLPFPEIFFGIFFLYFIFLVFYYGFYLKAANAYALTNKRVLIHQGWLSTDLICVDYNKITDLTVVVPFFESLITGTGDLHIDTAGTPMQEIVLRHIAAPYEIRKKLEEIRDTAD